MKNGKLKKLITLATVVASTFALVACGSSSSDDSKGKVTQLESLNLEIKTPLHQQYPKETIHCLIG